MPERMSESKDTDCATMDERRPRTTMARRDGVESCSKRGGVRRFCNITDSIMIPVNVQAKFYFIYFSFLFFLLSRYTAERCG